MADFSVPVETFRIQWRGGGGITVPRLSLRDRRAAGHRQLHWIYQRHLENVLYKRDGDGGTSGAIWKILNHTGLGSTALQVNGSAVANGQVTQAEYNEIVARFKLSTDGLDPCSKGRIRSCTLLPIATAAAVCRTYGRSDESVAFLRLFNQPVPEAWELREQAEEDAARGEHDLLLQEQLESLGQELELEDVDSFEQELQQMHPFTADADEETRMKAYAMANPPSMLTTEMKHYVVARTTVLDGRRSGSAVVSATVEGDTQSVLRFFGYLQRTHRVPDGAHLYPSLFFVPAGPKRDSSSATLGHSPRIVSGSTPVPTEVSVVGKTSPGRLSDMSGTVHPRRPPSPATHSWHTAWSLKTRRSATRTDSLWSRAHSAACAHRTRSELRHSSHHTACLQPEHTCAEKTAFLQFVQRTAGGHRCCRADRSCSAEIGCRQDRPENRLSPTRLIRMGSTGPTWAERRCHRRGSQGELRRPTPAAAACSWAQVVLCSHK